MRAEKGARAIRRQSSECYEFHSISCLGVFDISPSARLISLRTWNKVDVSKISGFSELSQVNETSQWREPSKPSPHWAKIRLFWLAQDTTNFKGSLNLWPNAWTNRKSTKGSLKLFFGLEVAKIKEPTTCNYWPWEMIHDLGFLRRVNMWSPSTQISQVINNTSWFRGGQSLKDCL